MTDIIALDIGGEIIRCTPRHCFWVIGENRWVHASGLSLGDELLARHGKTILVNGLVREVYPSGVQVYNFEVNELRWYFVGQTGVLVENGILK